MNYLNILLAIVGISMIIGFVAGLPSLHFNINDAEHTYNTAANHGVTYGRAQNSALGAPPSTEDLIIFGVTIPFVNQIFSFIFFMIGLGISILTAMAGYLYSAATLGTMFPSWMSPIFIAMWALLLLCIYKVISPMVG